MAGITGRVFGFFGLDPARQLALLALRRRLLVRQFEREPGRMVGFLVFLVIFGPIILLAATASGFAYVAAPEPWPAHVMGIVLCALWLAWIVLPLFAFRTNEGLDLSRLLIYPLSPRELLASALVGTIFDGPSYVTLPFFIAILVGWFDQPLLFVILLPAILLAYLLMMVSGQLMLTASMGLLRSRRFRDLSIVVFSLIGSSCYFINRAVERWAQAADIEGIQRVEPLLALRWLPPGACAQAVASAGAGAWPEALLWLGYALAWLAALLWAWWKLLLRMTTGAATWTLSAGAPKPVRRRAMPWSERVAAFALAWMPVPAQATMAKELKLIWRVPQRRIGLIQSVLAPFALIFAIFFGDMRALGQLPEWTALGLPAVMLFAAWGLASNMLGLESRGLPALLLTPTPRWQIFAGKGAAYFLMALVPSTLYAVVLGVTSSSALILFGLLAGAGAALAAIAVNMVASIYFTFPFDENSTTRQRSGGGCSTGIAQIVIIPIAMGIAAAPATLPMMVGVWLDRPLFLAIGSMAGLLYAAALFGWATRYAGQNLIQHEAEVLAAASLDK